MGSGVYFEFIGELV